MAVITTLAGLYARKLIYVFAMVFGVAIWWTGARWFSNSLIGLFRISDEYEVVILGFCFFALPVGALWIANHFDNWWVERKLRGASENAPAEALITAVRLARVETDRANRLFPHDEPGALRELLQRVDNTPDLRKALLFIGAMNIVQGEVPLAPSDWLRAEVERAKRLHPRNEADAIIELLTRSRDFPDQRARMMMLTAANVIAASRTTA